MTNSSPWKDPPFLSSVNHLYHGELLVITRFGTSICIDPSFQAEPGIQTWRWQRSCRWIHPWGPPAHYIDPLGACPVTRDGGSAWIVSKTLKIPSRFHFNGSKWWILGITIEIGIGRICTHVFSYNGQWSLSGERDYNKYTVQYSGSPWKQYGIISRFYLLDPAPAMVNLSESDALAIQHSYGKWTI